MSNKSKRITEKYDGKKHNWLHFILNILIVFFLTFIILNIVIGLSRVDGQSMEPTLNNEQVVMYWRLEKDFDRGDIVAIKMPSGEKYVKRIIGVPGDVIDIKDGFVYLNGKKLIEKYIKDDIGVTRIENVRVEYPYKVDEGSFWVMGDNRSESSDSRRFGSIIKENIKGKLLMQK